MYTGLPPDAERRRAVVPKALLPRPARPEALRHDAPPQPRRTGKPEPEKENGPILSFFFFAALQGGCTLEAKL